MPEPCRPQCFTDDLPWWHGATRSVDLVKEVEAARQEAGGHPAMATYRKQSLGAMVFMANKLEHTLPAGYDEEATCRLLLQSQRGGSIDCGGGGSESSSSSYSCQPQLLWQAEGGATGAQARQQLLQYAEAVLYLCSPPLQPLTVERIRTAHKLMMWGAEEGGATIAAGEFRTGPVRSGTGYIFPPADTIPAGLQEVLDGFTTQLGSMAQQQQASTCASSCTLAANLLYRFVTLHPFDNGNGRMSRLLAAYAAIAAGEPFFLHLSNGRAKTRQHYQQVLRHADKLGNTQRLRTYVLDCLHFQWQHALAYTRATRWA